MFKFNKVFYIVNYFYLGRYYIRLSESFWFTYNFFLYSSRIKKRLKKRRRKSKRYRPSISLSTNRSPSGSGTLTRLTRRSTQPSINPFPTTGRSILASSTFRLKVSSSSSLSSMYLKEHLSIYLTPARSSIISSFTSEGCLLWTTAKN